MNMVGNEISDAVKKRIVSDILYGGMTQRETVTETGASIETVNKYWQEFVEEVSQHGLDNVLESKDMLDATDQANTARLMRRLGLTPADCNRGLPIAGICGRLGSDPLLIPELMESAVRLGQPEFSAAEYAALIARIRRREKESGLSIEQMDAAHQAATDRVAGLRDESLRFQNTITGQQNTINNQQNTLTNLRHQSSRVTEKMQAKQRRIDTLDARIASEGTTLQELHMYATDKPYLVNIGLDIREVPSVRSVFFSFASLNYDPVLIISTINQIGNLQIALRNYYSKIAENQKTLQTLTEAQKAAEKEIQDLQEKKKAEENRVEQAKRDADRKIAELQQSLNGKMKAAEATEKLLAEYIAMREKLRSWGLEL